MRRLAILVLLVGGLSLAPLAHADTASVSLQYEAFTADGSSYVNTAAPGMVISVDGKGEGTITFTDTAVGSDYFNAFLDYELGIPFYDENGSAGGSAAAGQSWEIGDSYASSIYTDASAGALTNSNLFTNPCVAGTSCLDNYAGTYNGEYGTPDPDYNGDVALAMGFNYTVGLDEEEVVTLTASETKPSGFYLEQFTSYGCTEVTDGACTGDIVPVELYLSGTAVEEPAGVTPPSGVPEPGTLSLLGAGLLFVILISTKRFAFRQGSLAR